MSLLAQDASNIPLHCNICPKRPDFSDVSHLLTHIASKGHLSWYFRTKVKGSTDASSQKVIDDYDEWYEEWDVATLMQERMSQKEKKRASGARRVDTSRRGSGGECLSTSAITMLTVVSFNGIKLRAKHPCSVRSRSTSAASSETQPSHAGSSAQPTPDGGSHVTIWNSSLSFLFRSRHESPVCTTYRQLCAQWHEHLIFRLRLELAIRQAGEHELLLRQ